MHCKSENGTYVFSQNCKIFVIVCIKYINIILLSSWWNSQRELRKFILRRSEFPFPFFCFPFPFFCFFAFERFLLSQKENLIFRPQKWIFEISEVCFLPFFSFVLCAKVALAMCHNFKNVKITLLNVFDKLQYIPETFIESKRKFDFLTSKMDFRNFWSHFWLILTSKHEKTTL